MVCTDAAARGIDIPHVTHVVQADFAASAVDFLHRVSFVHWPIVFDVQPLLQHAHCLLLTMLAESTARFQQSAICKCMFLCQCLALSPRTCESHSQHCIQETPDDHIW